MASETPPSPPPPSPPPPTAAQQQYWCYHCDKRVSVETLPDQPDLLCFDCRFGFVESLPPSSSSSSALSPPTSASPDYHFNLAAGAGHGGGVIDEPSLGSQFLHVLRILAQVARDEHSPSPPPPPPPRADEDENENDFLRIEIDGWDHHSDNNINRNSNGDEDDDEAEEEEVRRVEIEGEEEEEEEESDDDDDDDVVAADGREEERRRRRDMLRLRMRDFATRARSGGRNRILDWAEVLMGLEDNSIQFRFEIPEADGYVGNPGDYVDAAEYEALLQNLAEAEGRRGAPPASKAAVDALKIVVIRDDTLNSEEEKYACAICKDGVNVGDVVKEMPCGHAYHGDCIVPWLAARNSCPVCRYELPTDDAEYEEERMKRVGSAGGGASGVAGGSGGF